MQQGDPLGPLLFFLTIQPFITKLRSDFSIFYLDDGSVGGNVDDVLHDLHLITEEAATVGLKLNLMKSELITDNAPSGEALLSVASESQVVPLSESTLLGTPIGGDELVDSTIITKIKSLELMGERLQILSSYDALLILRHSLAIPKVLYLLRTAPCFRSQQLEVFNQVLRNILSEVLNIDLSEERA